MPGLASGTSTGDSRVWGSVFTDGIVRDDTGKIQQFLHILPELNNLKDNVSFLDLTEK